MCEISFPRCYVLLLLARSSSLEREGSVTEPPVMCVGLVDHGCAVECRRQGSPGSASGNIMPEGLSTGPSEVTQLSVSSQAPHDCRCLCNMA